MMRLDVGYTIVVGALLLALAGCSSGGGGSGNQGALYPGIEYTVGDEPFGLAAADVDADGTNDLVVANRSDDSVSILIGNGDGTFAPGGSHSAGPAPLDVAAADVDGDGITDIVTINGLNTDTFTTSLGAGDGTFGSPHATDILTTAFFGMSMGDANGDELPDVIMAHGSFGLFGQAASVFLSDGDGTFTATPRNFVYPGSFQTEVEAGDLNGDEVLDLVVYPLFDPILVYLGNGDGTFQQLAPLVTPGFPSSIALADVDDDSIADLISYGWDTGVDGSVLYVLLGNGNGTFQDPILQIVDDNLFAIETGYLDDDQFPDLVIHDSSSSSDYLTILLGRGDGTFQDVGNYAVGDGGEVAIADFNSDGDADIAKSEGENDRVTILLGHGDGTFDGRRFTPFDDDWREFVSGDFDADGQSDVILFERFDEEIVFCRGNGSGAFDATSSTSLIAAPGRLIGAHLNNDGLLDLVGVGDMGIQAYLGDGNAAFQFAHQVDTDEGDETPTLGLLNGDDVLDLVFPATDAVVVLLGLGDGTFGAPISHLVDARDGAPMVGDFDDDGLADVVAIGDDNFLLLPGNGDGTLQTPQPVVPFSGSIGATASGDFDRDGLPDIAYTNGEDFVSVVLNLGGSTFAPPVEWPVPAEESLNNDALAVADLNGDNRPDIAANSVSDRLYLFLGNGDGTFEDVQLFRLGQSEYFEIADINSDGDLDFVSVHDGDDEEGVVVLLHR